MPRELIQNNILRHLAIIMDGNRRWARLHFIEALEGHRRGYNKLIEVIRWCVQENIQVLTVYAFSSENWNRKPEEVQYLMDLLREALKDEKDEFNENEVRVRIIGEKDRFAKDIQDLISQIEHRTSQNTKITLQLALSYGGRPELARAMQKIAEAVENKELFSADITEELIEKYLWSNDRPDLIIRTGGEKRLSNFLLWQGAYSELYFTKTFWPSFSQKEFKKAVEEYHRRQRRYGT